MTPIQRRNEIRKFCATFFSAIAVSGVVASLFAPQSSDPLAILFRVFAMIGAMVVFLLAYYIMQRLEESDD